MDANEWLPKFFIRYCASVWANNRSFKCQRAKSTQFTYSSHYVANLNRSRFNHFKSEYIYSSNRSFSKFLVVVHHKSAQ